MSFYIEISANSLNKKGEELCGDKVEVLRNDKETIMVLSDGLGSGVKANILATLTSKIVISMLSMGAEISDVVETVSTTLPVCKEREIAYSTFTILRIANDGDAHLVEYDNPETVIMRNGKALELDKEEINISGKRIREAHFRLKTNDICVMFSDGAIHAGVGKMLNFGWQRENIIKYLEGIYAKDVTSYFIQNQLLSVCDNLYASEPGDDTTVVSCRMCIPNIAHVMVGPPVNAENDELIVKHLMNTEGKKIVCGGTTSQIVSRILKRDLKVILDYISPDVPPIGYIDGVDLVTEGVVTLGKALEKIRTVLSGKQAKINSNGKKLNGADMLAQILIENCTEVQFYVGRALNPAHQNPDLPIDLSLKLRIVEDIAECIRKFDKKVYVNYY